jgi:hypothetical protein
MLRRSTWAILGLAVILVAATLIWQRTRDNREGTIEATPTAVDQLKFEFDGAQVSEVVIQDAAGNTVVIARGSDGAWVLLQPGAESTDTQAVENALMQLLSASTVSRLSSQTPLADLGLNPPAYRILLSLEDGSELVVNVGKSTPTGSGYYVLTSSADRALYVVNKFSLETFLEMVQAPPILPTPTSTAEGAPESTATP